MTLPLELVDTLLVLVSGVEVLLSTDVVIAVVGAEEAEVLVIAEVADVRMLEAVGVAVVRVLEIAVVAGELDTCIVEAEVGSTAEDADDTTVVGDVDTDVVSVVGVDAEVLDVVLLKPSGV